ncbi:MAG: NAD-dependent epimerase/dehydratase family protein [Opitutaceae bacterium]|jgi:nucleoside-diphosphate-sugar epimerase|nr:NAD-dependent epimerase/dehydratase family protein [Opitutaceae bacterium]
MRTAGDSAGAAALVTGGTGFLGRRLVARLLSQGRRVTVLARRPAPDLEAAGARVIAAPLSDAGALLEAARGAGTVFHMAAKVGVSGRFGDFHEVNVGGTLSLLEACRRAGTPRLVHTSTPSVVHNGRDLANADESLPLTTSRSSPYALTKAVAERAVLEADAPALRTLALRPHLVWGRGDPHLVPRVVAAARAGRLRVVGGGGNLVDMTHVENAVDAHLLAEAALLNGDVSGRAYFITNAEPVALWPWINGLLEALGIPPVTRRVPLAVARAAGGLCEALWRVLPLAGEPPMTRFVAEELGRSHWFNPAAACRDLGYRPRVSMAEGLAELVASLREEAGGRRG